MFGGTTLDASPLADANTMLDALHVEVTGLTTAADIDAAIDNWFDASGGGFETVGYEGGTTDFISRSIASTQTVEIGLRADDQAIRDTLKGLAKGALAGDPTLAFDTDIQRDLQVQSGADLLSTASSLAGIQGRLGHIEGQVEEASTRIAAQETSYGIARNELVSADPFETATRLQSVQLQLETHYTLTARLSRLSLTEYLR